MAAPGIQPLETTAPPPSRLAALMGNAKRLSDLGIALPVLLYSCGFVVLGCYSEENSLGLQAFPTIQFFSSGAAFLIIFASVMLVVIALRFLVTKYFTWLNKETAFGRLIKKSAIWIIVGSTAVSVVLSKLHMDKLSNAAMFVTLFAFLFAGEGWTQYMTRYYLYFNGFIIGLALLAWYAFVAYPAIPASFGGGKPRHAHILVDMKSMPAGFSRQLVKQGAVSSGDVGEFEVDIYLITDNSILIKVPRVESPDTGNNTQNSRRSAMVLQLRRSDVSAIYWDSRH